MLVLIKFSDYFIILLNSQEYSRCGEIHKESRNGEIYKCIKCGTVLDADVNGAINILNRFKNEALTVPHNTKIQNLIDSV